MDSVPLTKEGFEQLRAKLEHLKFVEIPRIAKAMGDAIENGDISESGEFEAARDEKWRVEAQISELEDKLARAVIIDDSAIPAGQAGLGRIVKVAFLPAGFEDEFVLVGGGEVPAGFSPVSIDSPMGRALVGHQAGDEVEYDAPRGKMRLRVVEVRSCP